MPKILSMGYTGKLSTNKTKKLKKNSMKNHFHKNLSERPYQWVQRKTTKKTRKVFSMKHHFNDSTQERF